MAPSMMHHRVRPIDMADYARQFREHGVVCIPGALTQDDIALVEQAFAWKMDNPGPWAGEFYGDSGARFFNANGDSSREPTFRTLLERSAIGDVAAGLFGSGPVWYLEEQLFFKEGGNAADGARRTPWHQDSSYEPLKGEKAAVFWIALDPVPVEYALEVVRGSHVGPIYNASKFDAADDTEPFYTDTSLPRLPDIQAQRDQWDIAAWPIEPGDLLVFHPGALHGGGGTRPGGRRRSMTLRFIGDDAVKIDLPRTTPNFQAQGTEAETIKRPPSHLDGYWALPIGRPVHETGATLVRP